MITAILIISIFNTGLLLLIFGGLCVAVDDIRKGKEEIIKRTESGIENATSAIFNMEQIKAEINEKGMYEI